MQFTVCSAYLHSHNKKFVPAWIHVCKYMHRYLIKYTIYLQMSLFSIMKVGDLLSTGKYREPISSLLVLQTGLTSVVCFAFTTL